MRANGCATALSSLRDQAAPRLAPSGFNRFRKEISHVRMVG